MSRADEAMGAAAELLRRIEAGGVVATRAVIVAAHPDDETIGAGALLRRLSKLAIVHVTDGAPRDGNDARKAGFADWREYAAARERELRRALAEAGQEAAPRYQLGAADQGAAFALPQLARDLARILREWRPDVLIAHAYEGGHPDHDAACFAAHAAWRQVRRDGRSLELVEMASYHASAEGGVAVGVFLDDPGLPVTTLLLDAAERALKQRMLDCFTSQQAVLAGMPLDAERFRPAPQYDFTNPPHPGTLHYEHHAWGIDGAGWRARAAEAWQALTPGR